MALTVTSAPWQQVSMPALDLRRYLGAGLQEGVVNATDMAVAQRGAGANFSVDIGAGEAIIQGDTVSNQGRYYVLNDAVFNLTGFTTANATNPRIDRVTLRIRDAFHGDAANDVSFQIVTGTATAGATLANLNGAAAVPASQLLLANILIPATATTVTTANIDTTVRPRVFSLGQIPASATVGQVLATTGVGTVGWSSVATGYATTLPGSPTDGQEAILVDSVTSPTYQWRFRWNAGSSNTDKWEFVGGTPIVVSGTSLTTTSATYANLSTDIAFTIPRGGFYEVDFVVTHKVQGAGQTEALALKRGAAATADADSNNPALATNFGGAGRMFAATSFAASDVVRLQGKTSAGTLTVSPGLKVVPVRVS